MTTGYEPIPPRSPNRGLRLGFLAFIFGALLAWSLTHTFFSRGKPLAEPRPITPRGDLAADEKATIELFRQASPSVVFITTLAERFNAVTSQTNEVPQGTGSGFIWDDGGDVVTNFHVVRGASGAQVTLSDHTAYPAELVGVAPDNDLAVLRIRAPREKLKAILVGSSRDLQVGQKVFAIGDPFGLDQTLTTGIVSAVGRTIASVTNRPIEDVIQTDAAINPGNSGGPLLDSAGRLIGVNTAIYSPSGSSAGIGFAIPVDSVNRVVPQLIKSGRVIRPRLGVSLSDPVSQNITSRLGIEGVLIVAVQPDSSAAAAGLRGTTRDRNGTIIPGDILQKIGDRPVKSANDVYSALQNYKPSDTVPLTIYRDGQSTQVNLKLHPPED